MGGGFNVCGTLGHARSMSWSSWSLHSCLIDDGGKCRLDYVPFSCFPVFFVFFLVLKFLIVFCVGCSFCDGACTAPFCLKPCHFCALRLAYVFFAQRRLPMSRCALAKLTRSADCPPRGLLTHLFFCFRLLCLLACRVVAAPTFFPAQFLDSSLPGSLAKDGGCSSAQAC